MTKTMSRALALAGALALLVVAATPSPAADLKARVPFPFTVDGRELSAGTYQLTVTSGVVVLHSHGGGTITVTSPLLSPGSRGAKLVFHRQGDRYRLFQVWNGEFGRQLPRSRQEPRARGGVVAQERVEIPLS